MDGKDDAEEEVTGGASVVGKRFDDEGVFVLFTGVETGTDEEEEASLVSLLRDNVERNVFDGEVEEDTLLLVRSHVNMVDIPIIVRSIESPPPTLTLKSSQIFMASRNALRKERITILHSAARRVASILPNGTKDDDVAEEEDTLRLEPVMMKEYGFDGKDDLTPFAEVMDAKREGNLAINFSPTHESASDMNTFKVLELLTVLFGCIFLL